MKSEENANRASAAAHTAAQSPPKAIYRVTLAADHRPDDPDGIRRLRAAFRRFGHQYGLRCLNMEEAR